MVTNVSAHGVGTGAGLATAYGLGMAAGLAVVTSKLTRNPVAIAVAVGIGLKSGINMADQSTKATATGSADARNNGRLLGGVAGALMIGGIAYAAHAGPAATLGAAAVGGIHGLGLGTMAGASLSAKGTREGTTPPPEAGHPALFTAGAAVLMGTGGGLLASGLDFGGKAAIGVGLAVAGMSALFAVAATPTMESGEGSRKHGIQPAPLTIAGGIGGAAGLGAAAWLSRGNPVAMAGGALFGGTLGATISYANLS